MVTAKTASGSNQLRRLILAAHQRNHLPHHVLLILHMPRDPPPWRHIPVVPTLRIYRIDTKELRPPMLELIVDGPNHAAIFKLEESPAGSREHNRRQTVMPKDQQFHLAPQRRREPFVVFALHPASSLLV